MTTQKTDGLEIRLTFDSIKAFEKFRKKFTALVNGRENVLFEKAITPPAKAKNFTTSERREWCLEHWGSEAGPHTTIIDKENLVVSFVCGVDSLGPEPGLVIDAMAKTLKWHRVSVVYGPYPVTKAIDRNWYKMAVMSHGIVEHAPATKTVGATAIDTLDISEFDVPVVSRTREALFPNFCLA